MSQVPASPSAPGPQEPAGGPDKDTRTWGMLCHLASLAGYVIPFGNIIGPLVVWLMKKENNPFVDHAGKEAINFQITMMIAALLCIPLIFAACIGLVLLPVVGILDLVFTIIAAVQTNSGQLYRYPIAIRFIK